MRRLLFLVIVGFGGAAILVSLGIWQVQRLNWKQAVIADINTRISAAPVELPNNPDVVTDAYLPVQVTGVPGVDFLRVLISQKQVGAGYRIITALALEDGRNILVDHGVTEIENTVQPMAQAPITITGNLQWPQEIDGFTPDPDIDKNLWFARDVPAMAAVLGADPVLLVARATTGGTGQITPLPVQTANIPNDHLQYAITWFSLAALWLAMSLYFLRRRSGLAES